MDTDGTLDGLDERLVWALQVDGRASASDLARATDVATSTATRRLHELEGAGVVDGYRPDLDYDALGYDVTAVFRLDVDGEGLADVVEDLRETGRMVGVYEVTGSDDVVAIGKFASTDELNARIRAILAHGHVRSVTVNVVRDIAAEWETPPVPVDDG
jgi:DNA-binding Lrp family transcriptional regulator